MLLPSVGSYIYWNSQKAFIRKQVKEKIITTTDMSEWVLLKFSESDLTSEIQWEHSKEFKYKGEMYDIIETKILGDTTYFWCWPDHEETSVNKKLSQIVAGLLENNPYNKECKENLSNFFKSLFYNEIPEISLNTIANYSSNLETYLFSCTTNYKVTPSPPPKQGKELS